MRRLHIAAPNGWAFTAVIVIAGLVAARIVGGRLEDHLPSLTARYEFADPASRSTSLPFTLEDGGLIVGEVVLSHHKERFVLDTGDTTGVTLRSERASKQFLTVGSSSYSDGTGRITRCRLLRLQSLTFGGYTVHDILAHGPVRGDFPKLTSGGEMGTVGSSPFGRVALTLDFKRRRLELRESGASGPHPPGRKYIPMRSAPGEVQQGLPTVDAVIEGRQQTVGIDTGNTGLLAITEQLAARLNISHSARTAATRFALSEVRCTEICGVHAVVGGHSLVANAIVAKQLPEGVDALIGIPFLKRFCVTFDFPGNRLFLDNPDP